jgi:hypothetical protein
MAGGFWNFHPHADNWWEVYREAFLLPTHVCGVLAFGLVSQKCAFALTQRGKERSDLPTNNVRSSNARYKKGRGLRVFLFNL